MSNSDFVVLGKIPCLLCGKKKTTVSPTPLMAPVCAECLRETVEEGLIIISAALAGLEALRAHEKAGK